MPKIIDVIHHAVPAYKMTQVFVVIDKPLEFKYLRQGQLLLAEDDGFFDCLQDRPGSRDAFAGRKFSLDMQDGTVVEAHGQIWSVAHPRNVELTSVGIATLEQLRNCYVFTGGAVLTSKIDAWLADKTPSPNYRKYDNRTHQLNRKESA